MVNPAVPPRSDLVTASLLHLMSSYASGTGAPAGQRELAGMIERHLGQLAAHEGLSPVLRETCQRLAHDWQSRHQDAVAAAAAEPQSKGRLRAMFGLG